MNKVKSLVKDALESVFNAFLITLVLFAVIILPVGVAILW